MMTNTADGLGAFVLPRLDFQIFKGTVGTSGLEMCSNTTPGPKNRRFNQNLHVIPVGLPGQWSRNSSSRGVASWGTRNLPAEQWVDD